MSLPSILLNSEVKSFLSSNVGPDGLTFEVPVLQDLIKVIGAPPTRGTHRMPVVGFKLIGVGVRDAAITYVKQIS